jgi:uncharacterized protein YggE
MPRFSRTALTILGCALAAGALASLVFSFEQSSPVGAEEGFLIPGRTITVNGEGEARAKPDMATISLGVVGQAPTAREALSANNERMKKVLDGLKAAGVDEKDLQTSGLNISQRYSELREGQEMRITGYEVSNQVSAKIRNLTKLGAILDQAVTLGANSMNGISFSIAEPDSLINDARRRAIADARARAELYAKEAGVSLGPVHAISEMALSQPPQPLYMRVMEMKQADSSVPVEGGEASLTAQVTVIFDIE